MQVGCCDKGKAFVKFEENLKGFSHPRKYSINE